MAAYGLTEREQEITRLLLTGSSTTEIADALVVSAHTVQQRLKSVFDKTGVRSRRGLVGRVLFSHYEPRLRDNESRAAGGQPLRGGPHQRQCASLRSELQVQPQGVVEFGHQCWRQAGLGNTASGVRA